MTGTLLDVETADFAAAARRLTGDVADPLTTAFVALITRLQDGAAMAGDDPGGRDWAASYDRAVSSTLRASNDVLNACLQLAAMFAQTARNYEAADAASAGHPVSVAIPHPTPIGLALDVPSAAGGSGATPSHWGLIGHLVGYVWPDGHQDRLRAVAAAWRSSAQAIWDLSEYVAVAAVPAMSDQIPEQADMTSACDAMYLRMRRLAAEHRALASACDALAAHIDHLHAEVEGELTSLVEWTAAIEGTGALLSFFSFGLAEVPTQAVEAARLTATAARVGALIEKFVALARTVGATVAAIAERADQIAAELVGLRDVRLSYATLSVVRGMPVAIRAREAIAVSRLSETARALPRLRTPIEQLQSKFKHASDFGVFAIQNGESLRRFGAALEAFVADTRTVRLPAELGRYYRNPAILSYNSQSKLVVIQHPDGTFWSAWRMSEEQLRNVRKYGMLGRG